MWLDYDKSWDRVELEVQRRHEKKSTAKSGWTAVQGRDLVAKLGKDKASQIMSSRKAAGLFYPDADFPDCDDEPYLILA